VHLARQKIPPNFGYEVVVVDNASTDGTAEVAQTIWARFGSSISLRIEHEARLGLAWARLAGVSAARGRIVSFIDDDNWVSPDWCVRLSDDFRRDPSVGVVGARGIAVLEESRPSWFERFESGFAVGSQRCTTGYLAPPRYFYGAGTSFRRCALAQLFAHGFRPALQGRAGQGLGAGDDAELCLALSLAGWRLWYDDDLTFEHHLPRRRLCEAYLKDLYFEFGYASALLDAYADRSRRGKYRRLLSNQRSFRLAFAWSKARLFYARRAVSRLGGSDRLQADVAFNYFSGRTRGLIETQARAAMLRDEISVWLKNVRADYS
jgi:glycosyltransferase involved in cell wall biosynthesis